MGSTTSQPDPDEPLYQRLQEGDMQAFDDMMNKYQLWVYQLAYRTLKNAADADDVAQDTFMKVYQSIGQFQPRQGRYFAGWLYRIAVNQSLNQLKKKKRESWGFQFFKKDNESEKTANPAELIVSTDPDPAIQAQSLELRRNIDGYLNKLSPEHRMVFILCEIDGLTYREIAELMECPLGTVMSRLHYTKKYLKEKLKDYIKD